MWSNERFKRKKKDGWREDEESERFGVEKLGIVVGEVLDRRRIGAINYDASRICVPFKTEQRRRGRKKEEKTRRKSSSETSRGRSLIERGGESSTSRSMAADVGAGPAFKCGGNMTVNQHCEPPHSSRVESSKKYNNKKLISGASLTANSHLIRVPPGSARPPRRDTESTNPTHLITGAPLKTSTLIH